MLSKDRYVHITEKDKFREYLLDDNIVRVKEIVKELKLFERNKIIKNQDIRYIFIQIKILVSFSF